MAKHWKERLDPRKHRDFMSGYQDAGGLPVVAPRDNLLESWVYFVNVAGFTFQFVTIDQIRDALNYFEEKIHPSTTEFNNGLEHYWQTWYCRLPSGIKAEAKRIKVCKALHSALAAYAVKTK